MSRGKPADCIRINTRYPRGLYEKLVSTKRKSSYQSLNQRVMELISKGLQYEAQTIVTEG